MSAEQWGTWRRPLAAANEDTFVTAFEPDNFEDEGSDSFKRVISPPPGYSAVAIKMFGTDAENEVADVQITGWMFDHDQGGVGPGQVLWQGRVTLGTHSVAQPITSGKWPSGTYLEVKTYDPNTFGSGQGANIARACTFEGSQTGLLILPTLGFARLVLEINFPAASQMASLGVLWKPVAKTPENDPSDNLYYPYTFRQTVDTGDGAKQLTSSTLIAGATNLFVPADSPGMVVVGDDSVDAAGGDEQGMPIFAGEDGSIGLPHDLSTLYIATDVDGSEVWGLSMLKR